MERQITDILETNETPDSKPTPELKTLPADLRPQIDDLQIKPNDLLNDLDNIKIETNSCT